LVQDLLHWLDKEGARWPAVISSAVLHYRFEWIHPFGDGNGRVGRALAAWELYRRHFDTHHIFSIEEVLWDQRENYYAALATAQKDPRQDLTLWIEFIGRALLDRDGAHLAADPDASNSGKAEANHTDRQTGTASGSAP
jgi:Fic family protein